MIGTSSTKIALGAKSSIIRFCPPGAAAAGLITTSSILPRNFINKIDQRHILKKEVEVIVSCSSSVGGWVVGYSILSLKAFAHQIISGRQSQAL